MAACILRIDLSAAARDFQLVAIEPGVPLLDRTGANYATLRRWLGAFVAEPVWEPDDSVLFFVADERDGRLEAIHCSPATKADLEGPLKEDVEAFLGRLGKIKPVTDFEKQLLPFLTQRLGALRAGGHGGEDCQFFKCRRGKNDWRLVWCWPQKRKDLEPATPVICPREDCSQLYLVRRQTKARCPRCSAAARSAPRAPYGRKVALVAALLLLLLLAGAGAYLATGPQDLSVTPPQWSGPAGSLIPFTVHQRRWRFWDRDVTSQVAARSQDRGRLDFEPGSSVAKALAQGKTSAIFALDDHRAVALILIGAPKAPESIMVEPASVSVPVGGQAPVKVIGNYSKDFSLDLSDAVAWLPQDAHIATLSGGKVEGRTAGKTTFKARFKGTSETEPEASVSVTVTPAPQKSLAKAKVDAPAAKPAITDTVLSVHPEHLEMAVNDELPLEIVASGDEPVVVSTTNPKVAELPNNDDLVVARGAGQAEINISQGKQRKTVKVTVVDSPIASLRIEPATATVAVGADLPLEVVAKTKSGVDLSVAPNRIVWSAVPSTEYVAFDSDKLRLHGVAVTPKPQQLVARLGPDLTATAMISVDSPPQPKKPLAASSPIIPRGSSVTSGKIAGSGPVDIHHGEIDIGKSGGGHGKGGHGHGHGGGGGMGVGGGGSGGHGGGVGGGNGTVARHGKDVDHVKITDGRTVVGPGGHVVIGSDDRTVKASDDDALVVHDVKLLGVHVSDITDKDFRADFDLDLALRGQYRLVDSDHKPLSDWSELGPSARATLSAAAIERAPDDEYDPFVERQVDGKSKFFQLSFALKLKD